MSKVNQLMELYQLASAENVNYYEVFNLKEDCTERDIKKAYRKVSMICHPDNYVSESEEVQTVADNCSHIVNKMYATLSDPLRRDYYDEHKKELDEKDIEFAKKEKLSKDFINAIFSDLPKYHKIKDEAIKVIIPLKTIYHGGKHVFEYESKEMTLKIPKGTLPLSAFTLKHVVGEDDVPEHFKGDLTVMCVYGSSKACKINKLDVEVGISPNEIKFDEKELPTKVKVLGSWVDTTGVTVAKSKKENKYKFTGLGIQNDLFKTKGDLIVEVVK